jgi:hypothetical protein
MHPKEFRLFTLNVVDYKPKVQTSGKKWGLLCQFTRNQAVLRLAEMGVLEHHLSTPMWRRL